MNNYDLKQRYINFLEYLNLVCSEGAELCKDIKKLLNDANKNSVEKYSLEWKLFYLASFIERLETVYEDAQNTIQFEETPQEVKQDNENIIIFPLFEDVDIYVPADQNLSDFWKNF